MEEKKNAIENGYFYILMSNYPFTNHLLRGRNCDPKLWVGLDFGGLPVSPAC